MAQLIAILKVVLSIIPVIIEAIKALEKAFPVAGLGAEKIAIIRMAFEEVYGTVNETMPPLEKVWAGIARLISALVALFNKTGGFVPPVAPAVEHSVVTP